MKRASVSRLRMYLQENGGPSTDIYTYHEFDNLQLYESSNLEESLLDVIPSQIIVSIRTDRHTDGPVYTMGFFMPHSELVSCRIHTYDDSPCGRRFPSVGQGLHSLYPLVISQLILSVPPSPENFL